MNTLQFESAGLLWGFLASFICSVGLVLTTKWHGRFSLDGTMGVQKFHLTPTPRIGGVAIVAGLLITWATAGEQLADLLGPVLLASLPAFAFGFAEDLTKRVSVRTRLFATMTSGGVAWLLTDASLTHLGVPGLDLALGLAPLSVLFTAFAVGGVANSINIIDGFNGLSSGSVAICLVSLGLIAHNVGDVSLASVCFLVAAVSIGFLVVNFPLGKLFLGDGGAYLLGFLIGWLAVLLAHRNSGISVWAPMMACAYPVFETLFTIIRRLWTNTDPGQPDNRHLHSLVKVGISVRAFLKLRADLRNASVSPFCWCLAAVPAALAVRFSDSTAALLWCCLFSFCLYLLFYWFVAAASAKPLAQTARVMAL
jgi:UDP-N-acetylmuramyl pentapeptide phosphotransferase/UDP-N-acetylglucosamine-1-phosphate transferase